MIIYIYIYSTYNKQSCGVKLLSLINTFELNKNIHVKIYIKKLISINYFQIKNNEFKQ